MIRITCLTIITSMFGISLYAQATAPARQWFYNASISNESRVNQEILRSNKLLEPINSMFKARTSSPDTCYIYSGKTSQAYLFDTYRIDSAIILSTCGNAANTDHAYKGLINILTIDYYVQDNKQLDELYEDAVKSFLVQKKRQDFRATIDSPDDTGAMQERIFVDNANAYHTVSIWKFIGRTSGVYRLKIEEKSAGR